jgi:hypothetical protein
MSLIEIERGYINWTDLAMGSNEWGTFVNRVVKHLPHRWQIW